MRARPDLVSRPKPKAILFTDIVGSTQYFSQHGDQEGMRMLDRHNRALFPVIEHANGRIVKTIGDSILAVFDQFPDALLAAVALQKRMQELRASVLDEERIHIRIGVHYGLVSEKERDVYGDAVNLTERIKSAAGPDQILVSSILRDLARANRLIVFESAGMYELKGHAEPTELFALIEAPELGPRTLIRRVKSTHRHYARYYAITGAALVLIAFVTLEVPAVRERVRGAMFGPTEKHIAMLPLDNIGNDPANQAVAEGLMDSMTGELSNLDVDQKMLWVVPASSVRARKIDDPARALKEFGATLVIKGSILRVAENVALTLNLINTKTMRQIGSVSASSSTGDLAAVERDALVQLGRLLNVTVADGAVAKSSSPAAYDLYIEALGYIQRYDKPGNLDMAISRLQSATAEDPNFALGFAAQGEAYRLKCQLDRNTAWLDLALENCRKAVRLNPQLARTFVTLARIHTTTGRTDLAAEEYQRALDIDSRNADAISGLARVHELAGRLQEAEVDFKRAAALRPDDWDGYNTLSLFYDAHGRFDDSIAQEMRALQLSPDNPQAYANLGATYLDKGDPSEYPLAEQALQKSLQLAPSYQAYGNLGLLYLQQGRYADAVSMNQKALALNDKDFLPWAYLELGYRWLGNKEKADEALGHVVQLAESAVRLNAQNFEAQSWLGLGYARQRLPDAARAHIEAALARAPTDNQTVLINAIEAYDTVGDEAAALRLIQQAQRNHVSISDLRLDPAMQPLLAKIKLH
jgi:class 3 adenylate cyclase/tetratricopeptide (TPR) repeat protein/TolB-like protein